jgi:transposase
MVIELGRDRRIIVDAGVDADALARVLAVLERR